MVFVVIWNNPVTSKIFHSLNSSFELKTISVATHEFFWSLTSATALRAVISFSFNSFVAMLFFSAHSVSRKSRVHTKYGRWAVCGFAICYPSHNNAKTLSRCGGSKCYPSGPSRAATIAICNKRPCTPTRFTIFRWIKMQYSIFIVAREMPIYMVCYVFCIFFTYDFGSIHYYLADFVATLVSNMNGERLLGKL